ncbi:MAG: pilus assembly protein [Alphaproteobacteria bacterium]|nr:pilus assembly protein [Alphaproteobacteria bacterium]
MGFRTQFLRNESGIAVTEFAIASGFFMILLLGGFELSRAVLVNQKVEKVAYITADVTSQATVLTADQMDEYLLAASQVMDPFEFAENGVVIVTSVERDPGDVQRIRWQYEGGGSLEAESRVGLAVGVTAVLPEGLIINERDNVIVAEVFYRYTPMFAANGLYEETDIYKTAVFKPRLGALTTAPQ